jgi:hypothetical protein
MVHVMYNKMAIVFNIARKSQVKESGKKMKRLL